LREAQEKDLHDANKEKSQRCLQGQEADKELSMEICRDSEAYLNQQNLAKARKHEWKRQNCELHKANNG
jgi:hypothetical protein